MEYATFATLPDLEGLQWMNDAAPPTIGTPIIATINACGPAIVTGYFTQGGYLGVLCDLITPPDWHVKQNKGRTLGHLFGPELQAADTPHDTATPYGRACFARDWLEALERRAADGLAAVPGIGSGNMGLTPDDVKREESYRRAKMRHDAAFARLRGGMSMDLFNVTTGIEAGTLKPRTANGHEVTAYMKWVAHRAGIFVGDHFDLIGGCGGARGILIGKCEVAGKCAYGDNAEVLPVYSDGAVCVPMPGYGGEARPFVELLDDAGDVVRSISLPINAKGALAMKPADALDWTGLAPVKRKRGAAKPVGRVKAVEAVECQPTADIAPAPVPAIPAPHSDASDVLAAVAALSDRITALETAGRPITKSRSIPAPANDAEMPVAVALNTRRERSDAERRAIVRAWRFRCEMRQRADLDRRALIAANGAYAGVLDGLRAANAESAATFKRFDEAEARANRAEARAARAEARTADKRLRTLQRMMRLRAAHRDASELAHIAEQCLISTEAQLGRVLADMRTPRTATVLALAA